MSSTSVDVLILGGGPTGLGSAWRLEQLKKYSWILVDAADRPGGMATTEIDAQGFAWDLGGHVIHSHFDAFNEAIACHKDWVYPQRGGWVRVQDQWVPTPIQKHLGNLEQGQAIIRELCKIHEQSHEDKACSKNLDEYYLTTFGPTLNSLFFAPFNFKQWAWPLSLLDHSWTSLRSGSKAVNVPAPSLALEKKDQPDDISHFPYPRLGTGSLWQSISQQLPTSKQLYSTRVTSIDLTNCTVYLSNGDSISYKRCICTLPLNHTIELINSKSQSTIVPQHLSAALKHSSTTITGFGFEGPLPEILKGKTWIFGADAGVAFHRATILSNFSQDLSGSSSSSLRWSIMFEVSTSENRKNIDLDTEALTKVHLDELRKWGAVQSDQKPISVWHKHLELGYPIPFVGRDQLLSCAELDEHKPYTSGILAQLEKTGLIPRGRFGGWRYESSNQDYAFVQGVEATDFIATGQKETVYWPDRPDNIQLAPLSSMTTFDNDAKQQQLPMTQTAHVLVHA